MLCMRMTRGEQGPLVSVPRPQMRAVTAKDRVEFGATLQSTRGPNGGQISLEHEEENITFIDSDVEMECNETPRMFPQIG
jgi:hypothetical protein